MIWYLGLISRHLPITFHLFPYLLSPIGIPLSTFPFSSLFLPRSLFFLIRHDVRFMIPRLLRKPFSFVIYLTGFTQRFFFRPQSFYPVYSFPPVATTPHLLTRHLFWRVSNTSQEHIRLLILFFSFVSLEHSFTPAFGIDVLNVPWRPFSNNILECCYYL